MTMEIGSLRGPSEVRFSSTGRVSGVGESAPDVELPTVQGAASEAEVRAFLEQAQSRLSAFASEMGDPETALMAVSNAVEASGMRVNRAQVDSTLQTRQAHLARQAEAAKKASEDQKSAAFWGLFAKIASYVGAAIGVAVSIASCCVTGPGGIGGAAAIIGACASGLGLVGQITGDAIAEVARTNPELANAVNGNFAIATGTLSILAGVLGLFANPTNIFVVIGNSAAIAGSLGTGTTQALQAAGVEVPPWLGPVFAGLGLAGAATAAAGAARSASTAASSASRVLRTVSAVTQGTAQVVSGASTAVSAVQTHAAEGHRIEARQQGQAARKSMEVLEELAEELRDLAQSISRQRGRTLEMSTQRSQTNSQLARNLVRG